MIYYICSKREEQKVRKINMVYLSTKVKNAVSKKFANAENVEFKLENISINGDKRGCSGFIIYHKAVGDIVVYINTEKSFYLNSMLYRYAKNDKDYKGLYNHHEENFDTFINSIYKMLIDWGAYEYEKSHY